MNSQEFRMFLIDRLRDFEKWAWRDSTENPGDYKDFTVQDWYTMFLEYMENEIV
jgi:hypothetical protein